MVHIALWISFIGFVWHILLALGPVKGQTVTTSIPTKTGAASLPDFALLPAEPDPLSGSNGSSQVGLCVDANPIESLNCTYLKASNGRDLPFAVPRCANNTLFSSLLVFSNLSAAVQYVQTLNTSNISVAVLLMPGIHSIDGVIKLENVSNVNLCGFGPNGGVTLSAFGRKASLIITQSRGINFANLAFTHSGSLPIVQFASSTALSLSGCTFRNNTATALIVYQCNGVYLSNCLFKSNSAKPRRILGSNWRIASAALGVLMNGSMSINQPNIILLNNVTFLDNHALASGSDVTPSGTCDNDDGCGVAKASDGGALRVTLVPGSQNCVVQVVNSTFVGNSGTNGGAVLLEQQKFIHKSLVVFSGCNFTGNVANGEGNRDPAGDCGAVAILSLMTKFNQRLFTSNGTIQDYEDVNYVFASSVIAANRATRNGGGICFVRLCDFAWEEIAEADTRSRFGGAWLVLKDMTFLQNVAGSNGAGLYALGSILDGVQPPTLLLGNVSFIRNYILSTGGVGALFAVKAVLLIQNDGLVMVENNNSAMYLHQTVVEVHPSFNRNTTKFINNTGTVGGAIFLVQPAQLILDEGSSIVFDGNHATDKGGAVFLQAQQTGASQGVLVPDEQCFLKTNSQHGLGFTDSVSLYFENNWSANGGAAAYLSSIVECMLVGPASGGGSTGTATTNFFPFLTVIKYSNNTITRGYRGVDNSPSVSLATDPFDIQTDTKLIQKAPQERFFLNIAVQDQFQAPSWAVLQLVDTTAALPKLCQLVFEPPQFQVNQLGAKYYSPPTPSGVTFSFKAPHLDQMIGSAQCCRTRTISLVGLTDAFPFSTTFTLEVASCPPGFKFNSTTGECVCRVEERRILHCNYVDQTVFVQQGSWGEVVDENRTLHLYPCPATYLAPCHTDSANALSGCPFPANTSDQCNSNRTGTERLCGTCKEGYGLAFQAFTCIPCDDSHVARLMWIIFAVFLVSVITVRYNRRISPRIRGVLFVLQNFNPYIFGIPSRPLQELVLIISSITNLNFAFGLCVVKNLDALESTFAGYTAPIIVAIVLLATYVASSQGWIKTISHESRLNGLLTLVFLAYQSLASTSLTLLYCYPVVKQNSSAMTTEMVFFLDGNIPCWQDKHLVFAIIALFVLVVFIFPLPIITFLVAIGKAPTKLRPFQDVLIFGHGFRRKRAWWFSVDLLRRLLISFLFIFITDSRLKVAFLEAAALLLLTVHIFVLPYKTHFSNIVEALVLLDLCIIGSLTLQQDERNVPAAVFFTLVCVPLSFMIIYLFIALLKYIRKKRNARKIRIAREQEQDERSQSRTAYEDTATGGSSPHARPNSVVAYAEVPAHTITLDESTDSLLASTRHHIPDQTGTNGASDNLKRPSLHRKRKKSTNDRPLHSDSREHFLTMSRSEGVGVSSSSQSGKIASKRSSADYELVNRSLGVPLLAESG